MDARLGTRQRGWMYRRAMTLPEVLLWQAIRRRQVRGLHFRRQHPNGPYVLDFYCDALKLAVEVDGESHDFGDRPARDARRDAWLLSQGVRTVRILASTVLDDVDDAVRTILAFVEDTPAPSLCSGPPPGGEDL